MRGLIIGVCEQHYFQGKIKAGRGKEEVKKVKQKKKKKEKGLLFYRQRE